MDPAMPGIYNPPRRMQRIGCSLSRGVDAVFSRSGHSRSNALVRMAHSGLAYLPGRLDTEHVNEQAVAVPPNTNVTRGLPSG